MLCIGMGFVRRYAAKPYTNPRVIPSAERPRALYCTGVWIDATQRIQTPEWFRASCGPRALYCTGVWKYASRSNLMKNQIFSIFSLLSTPHVSEFADAYNEAQGSSLEIVFTFSFIFFFFLFNLIYYFTKTNSIIIN